MNAKKDNKILIYLSVGLAVILLAIGAYFLRGTWFKASLLPGTVIKPADNYVVGIKPEFSTYDAVSGTPLTVKLFTQGAGTTTPFNGVQLYLTVPSYLTPTTITATDPNMTAKPPRNMGNGVWQILLYGGNETSDLTSGFATVTFNVTGAVTSGTVQILASGTTMSNLTGDQNTNVHSFNVATLFAVGPTAPITYTVTASVTGGNGTAVPATQTVNAGSSATVTITPDNGYHVASVTDNTTPVPLSSLNPPATTSLAAGASTVYTITNVQANHAIVVTFAANIVPVNSYVPYAVQATGNTSNKNIVVQWKAPTGIIGTGDTITKYKIYRQWYACYIETTVVCQPPVFVGETTDGQTLTFTDTFAVSTTFAQPYAYVVTSVATVSGTPNIESTASQPSNPVSQGNVYTMTLGTLNPAQGLIGDSITATGTGFATQYFVHFVGPVSGYTALLNETSTTTLQFTIPTALNGVVCYPVPNIGCVTAPIAIVPGAYKVSIVNAAGESNALDFTVLSSNGNTNSGNGNTNGTNGNVNGGNNNTNSTNGNNNGANGNTNSGNGNTNGTNGNVNGGNNNTNSTNGNNNGTNGNNNGTNTNTNSSGTHCADTNNDLQYDACSLTGNGPTCTTAAYCTYIPTGVTATADTHSQNIFVRWNPLNLAISAPTDPQGLNGYKVYRSPCTGDPATCTKTWTYLDQTNGSVAYVDTTGTPGTAYVYAITSIVAQIESAQSLPSNLVTIGTNGSGTISSNMLILPFATKSPYHLTAGGVGANITWTSSNSGLITVSTNTDGSADILVVNSGSGMPAGNVNGGVSFITASGSTGYATMLVVVWPRGDTDGNFVVGPVDQNNVANGWSMH